MKKAWMAAALLFVLTAAGMGIGLAAQKNGQKDEKEWREIHLGMFLENPVSFFGRRNHGRQPVPGLDPSGSGHPGDV